MSIRPHPEEPAFAQASAGRLDLSPVARRAKAEGRGRPPISGLPEIGIIDAQVGQARLACGAACARGLWCETRRFASLLRDEAECVARRRSSALAAGSFARGLEHELAAAQRFEDEPRLNRELAPGLGPVLKLAGPGTIHEQLGLEVGERTTRHDRREELVPALADGFIPAVAVRLLGAPVPLDDGAVEIPDADRVARELDEAFLQLQLAFGF